MTPSPRTALPSRHRGSSGTRKGAGAGRDAPRMQFSIFTGFFLRYKACFDTTGETSSSPLHHHCGVSADKDLSVITPAERSHTPGARRGFGSRQGRAAGVLSTKAALAQPEAGWGFAGGFAVPRPPAPRLRWQRLAPASEPPGSVTAGGKQRLALAFRPGWEGSGGKRKKGSPDFLFSFFFFVSSVSSSLR